jgi:flagellar biosynthesis/type III secretory pathway chaperone
VSKLTPADRDRLSELLDKELEIFIKIQELTEKQTELLAGDDIESFDSSLDKRQELIEKINGLHQDSNPLMQSYVSSSEDEKSSEIDELRAKIQDIIETCAKINNENIAAIQAKSEEHKEKIDKQSKKRKGIGGYAQAVPNTPEMFDKKT